jgi:hypothetical protein|eukprot:CAMPEP_0174302584 /NCGR_PEP_ID=MMETSP0809-20121228/59707_1 /TAXON_ID=73025 ORGANISM="Eutreptiella gymnastica-like, Strain CCMP1594" /NCGR_SAMPLE_ID=MMETSP0809 /ASSEMBLY_ACC=CAM_ASM_000658 /LENGTH=175 /DNA_ID=CAMNT_0015408501 /DNA_START=19 /DNA_END=546 /DNA_ORIENTATION=-
MATLQQRAQRVLDTLVPQVFLRWGIALGLCMLYVLRVTLVGGYFIISYGVGIFILNLLIQFLSPQTDPDFDEDGLSLPTKADEEYRPFVRKLPEYKFWLSTCKAFLVAMMLTTSRAFDVPVYWPILLFYFILLTALTMKKRIEHMIKHKYVPLSGKKPKPATRAPQKEFEKELTK